MSAEYATVVVVKRKGGRATVQNDSKRGLFHKGETYYNHQFKDLPEEVKANVVIKLSTTGRRMVQKITTKETK